MNDTTASSLRYDSVSDLTVLDESHTLQTYVSDMLALERHIREPIVRQGKFDDTVSDDTVSSDAIRIFAQLDMMTDVHIQALETQLKQLGGAPATSVKSTIATMAGSVAATIDGLRESKISKSLRDDYTALGLAAISYTMLHTVALGFGDGSTAQLAKRHLGDTAALVMEIGRVMPGVVLQELLDDGHSISPEARRTALLNTHDAWSDSGT